MTKKPTPGAVAGEQHLLECPVTFPGSDGVPFEPEHLQPAGLAKRALHQLALIKLPMGNEPTYGCISFRTEGKSDDTRPVA